MNPTPKKIVIVGGGFAGVNLIKKLAGNRNFHITLVDRNNYHFFPPLLYQVSTAFIEPSNISYPFRRLLREDDNLRFHMGSLVKVHKEKNIVETENGQIPYDYLILAMGTETNYFGMKNVQENALPMKTIDEALILRNSLLLNMEKAVRATDKVERNKLLNIVIAGGGATGVELAGMLAELGRYVALKEYPELPDFGAHLFLIDAGPELLPAMSKKAQDEAYNVLNKLGVQIILNTAVTDYSNGQVFLANDRVIEAGSLIWASGVIGREVPGLAPEMIARGRRIIVDEFNKVKGTENIFALGDQCVQTSDSQFPNGHPQVAQVAIQQGVTLAKNLIRINNGLALVPFRYNDKGSMAIISKYKAVADLPKFSFKGFFAWLVWLFIHIIPLIGFRNKLRLAFTWFWSFITNDPTLRLIIRPERRRIG